MKRLSIPLSLVCLFSLSQAAFSCTPQYEHGNPDYYRKNGHSESNEMHTLPELGVHAVDLDYKEARRTDASGNLFRYRAQVKDGRGAQVGRWAWDVFLVSGQ
jgi:hypothetical protein